MTSVAVVAHAGKSFGGGLGELRPVLERAGVSDPLWYEVPKSKYARKCVQQALAMMAPICCSCGVATAWCSDVSTRSELIVLRSRFFLPVPAIFWPAISNIPQDIERAVEIGLHGRRRVLDVGRMNGERFAVMAGTGLDALMIRDADRDFKDRFGRAAYLWTGAKHLRIRPFRARIKVDGVAWFDGKTGCVLIGNVGKVFGGITAFDEREPRGRQNRSRRRHRSEDDAMDTGIGAHRGRERGAVPVRSHDQGEEDPHQARSRDAIRARRW